MASPTLFNQYRFFKALSSSLYEYDWYNFVEQWQSMVAVNAPIPEFTYNLMQFFSNARNLLPEFHRYMNLARQDPEFLNTLTNILMSTPLMIKVQNILHSQPLFNNYLTSLKLDNPSASHNQVMQSIQSFLSTLPAPTRLEVQRAFAEAEASDSMGLSSSTLDVAYQLLHRDTQLYIDFLNTLKLNQTRNMAWDLVVSKIRAIVVAVKPYAWPDMEQFLNNLHWGHYQEQYEYETGYEEEYYDEYGAYEDDGAGGMGYNLNEQSNIPKSSSSRKEEKSQGTSNIEDNLAKLSVTDRT
ncbi:hypothetical protein BGZ76_002440 [Entomortierella beljakovae]|nr:hypothetical protein BGZ76_002440 [Entomortierella beljakovae]